MSVNIEIPIKILHASVHHIVTVELKNGELFRGKLEEAEDNMNIHLSTITVTRADGAKEHRNYAFIRGSQIRFMILPDILKEAPMFRKDLTSRLHRAKGHGLHAKLQKSMVQRFRQ